MREETLPNKSPLVLHCPWVSDFSSNVTGGWISHTFPSVPWPSNLSLSLCPLSFLPPWAPCLEFRLHDNYQNMSLIKCDRPTDTILGCRQSRYEADGIFLCNEEPSLSPACITPPAKWDLFGTFHILKWVPRPLSFLLSPPDRRRVLLIHDFFLPRILGAFL